ncbi:MAG: hypothetical protein A2X37_09955 [Elusimicrobia bacterium GWA2_66_18]|nr:MAG: hypothetical protein A2X37_09955 [Elusimicrobia bacterium GWA2_66_18]
MKRLAAAALAAALTATGCAAGPKGGPTRSLVVEGWAPLQSSGRPDARRRAVADAQRRAVEEAGGVEIASISLVDDAAMSRQRLSSTAHGTVRRFKVLSERDEDGMLKVQVRAEVVLEPQDGVRRPGWFPGTGPQAYIAAAALADDEGLETAAKAAFIRAWTRFGGEVAGSLKTADLALRIAVETRPVDEPRVRPFVSARARFSISATQGGAGAASWAVVREAAALGLDVRDARARALEAAASAAAEAAACDLPSHLWLQARATGRP